MMNEIYVKRAPYAVGDDLLQEIVSCFGVHASRQKAETREYAVTVAINRKDSALQGIEQYTPRYLGTHAGQRAQHGLRCVRRHFAQWCQSDTAIQFTQHRKLLPESRQLYTSHPPGLHHGQHGDIGQRQESLPYPADQAPKKGIGTLVRRLPRPHGELDVDQLV